MLVKVGRLPVMTVLQTARAKELGLPERRAKSWRLNRAIFYVAAKRGFKHQVTLTALGREHIEKRSAKAEKAYSLGNEMAYVTKKSNRICFTIGGKPQTEADFKRQIQDRFGKRFEGAWKESLAIIHLYPNEVLLSQNRFFSEACHPRRDELASKWPPLSE